MEVNLFKEMGNTHYVHNGLKAKLMCVLMRAREEGDVVDFTKMRFTPVCANVLSSCYVGEDGQPALKIKSGTLHPTLLKYLNENCARLRNKLQEGDCITLEFKDTFNDTVKYIQQVPAGTKFVINEPASRNQESYAYMGLFTCLRPDVEIYMGAIAAEFIKFMHGLFCTTVSRVDKYICVKDEGVIEVSVDTSTNTVDMDKYGTVGFDEFRHRFFAVPAEIGQVKCKKDWKPMVDRMFEIVCLKYRNNNVHRSFYDFLDKGDT